jgi:hypothetical protein
MVLVNPIPLGRGLLFQVCLLHWVRERSVVGKFVFARTSDHYISLSVIEKIDVKRNWIGFRAFASASQTSSGGFSAEVTTRGTPPLQHLLRRKPTRKLYGATGTRSFVINCYKPGRNEDPLETFCKVIAGYEWLPKNYRKSLIEDMPLYLKRCADHIKRTGPKKERSRRKS